MSAVEEGYANTPEIRFNCKMGWATNTTFSGGLFYTHYTCDGSIYAYFNLCVGMATAEFSTRSDKYYCTAADVLSALNIN
jgi:hypothetical protein